MKKLIYLGVILILASCNANPSKESDSIKIGNLEIMTKDLGNMPWDNAQEACMDLGDGWRLPTKDELNILYENKEEIGGFTNYQYWSSEEYGSLNAWGQVFGDGEQVAYRKDNIVSVRVVRAM